MMVMMAATGWPGAIEQQQQQQVDVVCSATNKHDTMVLDAMMMMLMSKQRFLCFVLAKHCVCVCVLDWDERLSWHERIAERHAILCVTVCVLIEAKPACCVVCCLMPLCVFH